MRLSGKMKNTTTNNEGWGLGLFLVFFPDNNNNGDNTSNPTTTKKTLSSFTSFSSFTNHHHHQLFYKAQSTISICVILVVFTFLLFTLSNFDSTISQTSHTNTNSSPRRWLSDQQKERYKLNDTISSSSKALQGMGTLFRRGTRAMNDLIVAHLPEDMNRHNFVMFMRILHLSGITSKADVVFLYSSHPTFSNFIHQENESFLKLLSSNSSHSSKVGGFNLTLNHFTKQSSGSETLWGRKVHSNHSNSNHSNENDEVIGANKINYGSVVGFEVSELDPADSLSGFLDHIPIRLRRWACYPMLLGRLRRNFKHIMLIDANTVIPLGDPLSKIRHKGAESVHFWRNSEKTRPHDKLHVQKDSKSVNADVIVGGMRGVRLLSNAVLNEIVRVSLKRKSKTPVTDSGILSQVVNNESLLKSSNVDASVESSFPNANSVMSLISSSSSSSSILLSSLGMFHRDQNGDVNHFLHRQICTSVMDTFIYRDCYKRIIN